MEEERLARSWGGWEDEVVGELDSMKEMGKCSYGLFVLRGLAG